VVTHDLDDSVDQLESGLLHDLRVEVVVQVSVIDRQTLHVESQRGEPLGIGRGVDCKKILVSTAQDIHLDLITSGREVSSWMYSQYS
jgi:hypothetical protein